MQKKERKYIEKSNPNKVCQSQLSKHLKMFMVKKELCYQNTISGGLQLSETHGCRLC